VARIQGDGAAGSRVAGADGAEAVEDEVAGPGERDSAGRRGAQLRVVSRESSFWRCTPVSGTSSRY